MSDDLVERACDAYEDAFKFRLPYTLNRPAMRAAIAVVVEECAKVAENTYAKDAFHFELGTAAAANIRALAQTNKQDRGEG